MKSELTPVHFHLSFLTWDAPENAVPVGHSKMGGCPDLPARFKWPTGTDGDLTFYFQVNLSELAKVQKRRLLPAKGMLWFFWDGQTWGFHPDHRANWKVLFNADPGKLSRRDYCGPCETDHAIIDLARKPKPCTHCGNPVRGQLFGSQAIGYQIEEPRLKAQLAIHGIDAGRSDAELNDDPKVKKYSPGMNDWQFLLQYDDGIGARFFLIREKDLKERKFKNVWFSYQTT